MFYPYTYIHINYRIAHRFIIPPLTDYDHRNVTIECLQSRPLPKNNLFLYLKTFHDEYASKSISIEYASGVNIMGSSGIIMGGDLGV